MINIEDAAKQSLQKFYSKKKYPEQPEIDMDNIRVQIEEFGWETAKYRINLFFLHQRPSFIPYHQNFWMAHRLFMKETGEPIKHDQVYTARAVHPDPELSKKENIHKEIVGFFPGNYYFKKEFDFIDEVLKSKKKIIKGGEGIFPKPKFKLEFKNGIADLANCEAHIIQFPDHYKIILEAEKYHSTNGGLLGLYMNDLSFTITLSGKISEAITTQRYIPGLC